jgi:hypothetical protein
MGTLNGATDTNYLAMAANKNVQQRNSQERPELT